MKRDIQNGVDRKDKIQLKSKGSYFRLLLKIIDHLIIFFKLLGLMNYVFAYKSALNEVAQKQAFHYLMPFIIYSIIGTIRIFKYRKLSLSLLFAEVIFNIYFIINVGQWQAFYLIMTIVSLFIILKLFYHITIIRKDKIST